MINVLFRTESHYPVDRKKIVESVTQSLSKKVKSKTEVSISIIGDRLMKRLNSTYRKKDTTTDVLSFPQNDPSVLMAPFVDPPDGILYLGDILVSFPMAVKEAGEENKLVDDTIVELVLHGLDHLLGIHHPE
ncbi:rRNA maturation RNase YbeY [Candidatus Gottesmanbacteria bacterium]|nr:rRNA maturation RNase YbeY [Candidatus Gottesmanbacteria bacterium]